MADLNQVVDLGAAPDACRPQRGAIDARVGADLHVVFDHHGAYLWDLDLFAFVGGLAEAIASENRPSMDDDTVTNRDPRIQGDVGEQPAVGADPRAVCENTAGADSRAGAYAALLDVFGLPTAFDRVIARGDDTLGEALGRNAMRKRARAPGASVADDFDI